MVDKKRCSKCKEEKPTSEFYRNPQAKDGLKYHCKACCSNQQRLYRHSGNGKTQDRKYAASEKGKITRRRYKRSERFKEADKIRRQTPETKILHSLRIRLNKAIKRGLKAGRSRQLLGCTIEELKLHLERQMHPWMTWNNYPKAWHIDRIIPCHMFDLTKPEEQKKCFHWTNLRPLWAKDNLTRPLFAPTQDTFDAILA